MFGAHERLLRAQLAESNAKLAESNAKLAESNANLAGEHVRLVDTLAKLAAEEDRSWKLAERLGNLLGERLKVTFPDPVEPHKVDRQSSRRELNRECHNSHFFEDHFADDSEKEAVSPCDTDTSGDINV
jgi:hypothetical protein